MKAKHSQTAGYFSAFFILGSVIASLGPTLPDLAAAVDRNPDSLGFLFSIRSLGYLTGSLLGGYLYERIRGHRVMSASLVILALALGWIPQNVLLLPLVLLLFAAGAGLGALDIGSNTLLARVHHKNSGPFLNGMYLLAGIGSMLTPLYLSQVGFRLDYWGLGLLAVLAAAWLALTPSPGPENTDLENQNRAVNPTFLLIFCLLAFLFVGIEISYGGWIFTYAQRIELPGPDSAYLLTSLFWLSITAGRLIAIPVSAVLKPSPNVLLLLGGGVLSSTLTALLPISPAAVWLGTAGIGLSLSAIFPTTFHLIKKIAPLPEKSYGLVWASGSLGGMFLPWLSGELVSRIGPVSLMTIILISWLAALGLFLLLTRQRTDHVR
jgi:FHS family Na+ dependent glucose MFS transporter 1